TATSSGTFLVVAGSLYGITGDLGGSGAYRLTLAKTGSAVEVTAGDEGGPLANGAMQTGTIDVGDLDVWTITADAGESIVVRMGEVTAGSQLSPQLRIYGPTGTLLPSSWGTAAAEDTVTATSSGTFLVVAGSLYGINCDLGGSGPYLFTLAKPGPPIYILFPYTALFRSNGAMQTGTIDVGDLDVWTITADAGESIVVRMGEVTAG